MINLFCNEFLKNDTKQIVSNHKYLENEFSTRFYILENSYFVQPAGFIIKDNVILNDNFPSNESLKNISEMINLEKIFIPDESIYLEGEYFSLVGLWSGFFLHWITEFVARLMLLKEINFQGKYIIEESMLKREYITKILEKFGIGNEKLHITNNHCILKPEKLFVLEKLYLIEDEETPEYILFYFLKKIREFIIENFALSYSNSNKKIYISRAIANNSRKILNEKEVFSILKDYSFNNYVMENLPFEKQIKLASKSNFLAGGHGAGFIHALFMPENSIVIELFDSSYINTSFFKLMKFMKHRHFPIINETNLHDGYVLGQGNFHVNIDLLKSVLKEIYS